MSNFLSKLAPSSLTDSPATIIFNVPSGFVIVNWGGGTSDPSSLLRNHHFEYFRLPRIHSQQVVILKCLDCAHLAQYLLLGWESVLCLQHQCGVVCKRWDGAAVGAVVREQWFLLWVHCVDATDPPWWLPAVHWCTTHTGSVRGPILGEHRGWLFCSWRFLLISGHSHSCWTSNFGSSLLPVTSVVILFSLQPSKIASLKL